MSIRDLPSKLPEPVLALRAQLPLKPAAVSLTGQRVRLEPAVAERDASPLFAVSNGDAITLGNRTVDTYDADALVWRYLSVGPFDALDAFRASLQRQVEAPNALCLCVFDQASNRQIGVTNLMNNVPADLKIELGGIWYSPIMQRTGANTEATYLMLKHAFGLGYRRVEWKCHHHNERSRQSALRMGFTFEGIQQNHMVVKDRSRDTAWFRMLDTEWPEVKAMLEALLYHA
jgi:RimJ/RimL family protein N-acetyltransferase